MNWLRRLLGQPEPQKPAIQCPQCLSIGFEDRGPLRLCYEDGTSKEVGRLYGCPHCGLAFFRQDGAVKKFGHLKARMNQHPAQWAPDTIPSIEKDDAPMRDTDLPWRRR